VGAALIHADLTKLIGAFRVYANAPKNRARLPGRRAHALMSMPDKQLVLPKSHTNWPRTLEASGHWPDEKITALYRIPKLKILKGASTGPDLKPNESSPHPHVIFLEDPF